MASIVPQKNLHGDSMTHNEKNAIGDTQPLVYHKPGFVNLGDVHVVVLGGSDGVGDVGCACSQS